MDLNQILIWTVAVTSVMALFRAHGQPVDRSRRILSLFLLLTLAASSLWRPEFAGLIAGGLWAVFVLAPGLLVKLFGRLMTNRWLGPAWLVAELLGWLHPFEGNWSLATLVQAIRWIDRGREAPALESLKKLEELPGYLGRAARVIRLRQTNQWQEFLDQISAQDHARNSLSEPPLMDAYFQALGELGRRSEMLAEFQGRLAPVLQQIPIQSAALTLTKIAAFCGEDSIVRQLWPVARGATPQGAEEFWVATALQVCGHQAEASHLLKRVAENSSRGLAALAVRRNLAPLPSVHELPFSSAEEFQLQLVRECATRCVHSQEFDFRAKPWATWSLAAILIAVFLAEVPGGSENYENLIALGALQIPEFLNGDDWWRPFTAAFLHYGPIHVAMNTLGLIILGQQVERLWGGIRLLLSYLAAAVGSMYFTPWLMELRGDVEPTILVGASGGVMGLIGGLAVQAGIMLWKGRTPAITRAFLILLLVICLQVAFDQTTPNVSSEAHLLGLLIGGGFGIVWNVLPWKWRLV